MEWRPSADANWFQSSPGQKAECNDRPEIYCLKCKEFQSSPGLLAGCNRSGR